MTSRALYLTDDIRHLETAAADSAPPLMWRAGRAAADLATRLVGERDREVLVLAGPGNNGGDAYVVATELRKAFFPVTVVAIPNAASLPPDAARARAQWSEAGGEVLDDIPRDRRWGLIVDGLFGIGLKRDVSEPASIAIEYANAQPCPILALDLPSGLDADTGRIHGCVMRATHTITFLALKPGLLTLDGPDSCGEVSVADLDLDVSGLRAPTGWVAGPGVMPWRLRPRSRNFHKGQAGSLGVLGGATGMVGAALLAARAALRLGTGRVYVGLLAQDAPAFDPGSPELMLRHPDDALGQDLDALVLGPGLGQSERAEALVAAAIASEMPCVLDADALNLLADNSELRAACGRRQADTLLTPHPGEAARLLGRSTREIQDDRLAATRELSRLFNAHTVLKGNGSVLVARDGHWFVNTSGHSGMASAGMGDVLAGLLGALLAQGYEGEAALMLGVHLHGAAAELAARDEGEIGTLAGDLIAPARRLWNRWIADQAARARGLGSG